MVSSKISSSVAAYVRLFIVPYFLHRGWCVNRRKQPFV